MSLATWGTITAIVVAAMSAVSFVSAKIFKLGKVAERLQGLEDDIKEVKEDVKKNSKAVTERIDDLMKMLAQKGLASASSPRQLTPEGKKVVRSSGIDEIVDSKFAYIVAEVKKKNPANSYQAEKAVLDVVEKFIEDPKLKDAIEKGAFNSGYFLASVLFAGGLYIRDRVLTELGFNVAEIDMHQPPTTR